MKKPIAFASLAMILGLRLAFANTEIGGGIEHESGETPPLTMDADVEVMLLRIGITPDGLAAAGLNSTTVQAALANEHAALDDATALLVAHDGTCSTLKVEVDGLRRLIGSGEASADEIARMAIAKVELASATNARQTFLMTVCMALCEHFNGTAATCIDQLASSKRWKTIPVEYRTQERTEAQWIEIRNALAAKRTHEKAGLAVPEEVTQFLATLNSDQQVATATSSCNSNLPGVDAMWQSVFAN